MHILHCPLGLVLYELICTDVSMLLQHHLHTLLYIHYIWQIKRILFNSPVVVLANSKLHLSYVDCEYTFRINSKNLFKYDRPLTSIPNKAPLRLMGQQPAEVNSKKEVTNCFIQSPPLSASVTRNCTLDDFCS